MSQSFSVTKKDAKEIIEAGPAVVPPLVKTVLLVFIALGAVALVLGLLSDDSKPTWIAFQVNMVFWFAVSVASAGFTGVFHICNAQWVRPLKRLFECAIPFALYSFIPLAVMCVFGSEHIFAWTHEVAEGKELWLESWFVYLRSFIAVAALFWIARKLVRGSLKRDLIVAESGVTGADKSKWSSLISFHSVNASADNVESELSAETSRIGFLSPVMVIFYFLFMSIIAFDQIMSVDYHWFSTLFGVFYFMTGVYCAVAWVAIAFFVIRKSNPLLLEKVKSSTLHDLGKLLFGFGIFWAYMFWSHYLPLWYSNLPEFTGYLIPRLRLEPWHSYAWFVLAMCFIIPFLIGLNRDFKKIPLGLACTASIVLIGCNAFVYLLIAPTLYPDSIPIGIGSVLISLGFGGVFAYSAFRQLEKLPQIPFGDLYDPTCKVNFDPLSQ